MVDIIIRKFSPRTFVLVVFKAGNRILFWFGANFVDVVAAESANDGGDSKEGGAIDVIDDSEDLKDG